jgi:SAM-dependent methyltransferase
LSFEGRQGDMRDLPWFDEFDAAFCFWSSLGYFEEGGDREFLEAVWRALKPGAPFLIDTQSIETVLPGYLDKDWFKAGDWTVLEERKFDCETSRVHGEWTFVQDGESHRKNVSIRMYTCRELTDLLTSCGFGDFEAFDTATGDPFSLGASHLALIPRKKA